MNEHYVNKRILSVFFSDWRIVEFWPFLTHCSLFSDLSESGSEDFRSLVNSRFFSRMDVKERKKVLACKQIEEKVQKKWDQAKIFEATAPKPGTPEWNTPKE